MSTAPTATTVTLHDTRSGSGMGEGRWVLAFPHIGDGTAIMQVDVH
ncbi:hypothetical protein [Herbihabitans rhizosphaerae]|nr:hypothetical protein [Herbihabitans rhizosphaerae]